MQNSQEMEQKDCGDGNPDFSLPEESRWLAFWDNLKGLFVKAVASSVSATPAETDLLLASAVWYSTILGNLRSAVLRQRQPAVSACPVETSLVLKSRSRCHELWGNVKALLRASNSTVSAVPLKTDLLLEEKPWFRTIFCEVRSLFAPRPVYVLSAQPVAVSSLFQNHRFRKRSAMFSVVAHVVLVGAILWLPSWFASEK